MDRRLLDLFGIEVPILQAPMAGSNGSALAIAVSEAGGLGALPCATLSIEQMTSEWRLITQHTSKPVVANFFCHAPPTPDAARDAAWKAALRPHYERLGLAPDAAYPGAGRAPFNDAYCDALEPFAPQIVSFHFGLPEPRLVARVKRWGAKIVSTATTVAEARWLEANCCDVIIAQGAEAGGHRGVFLDPDSVAATARQAGLFALLPQVIDAVRVPVIAAGGIADGRGVAAAMTLGASAAQLGTAFLLCPEAKTSAVHRAALGEARDDTTALTNLFTGRPARGLMNHIMIDLGPINRIAPDFPLASDAMAPLKAKAEADQRGDYSSLWAGQAAALARPLPAAELTRKLWDDARATLAQAGTIR